MRGNARKTVDTLYLKSEMVYREIKSRKDAKKYLKEMGPGSPELHEQYIKEVVPYWKKYNLKPAEYWFRYFSQDGVHTDPRYIPEDMFFGMILPYYSNMFFRRPYEDKCMHNVLFPDVKRPRTIVKNIACEFYTDDLRLLTKNDAFALCKKESSFIVKPSIDSGAGRLIQFYNAGEQSTDDIKKILKKAGNNYIVQEVVEQHPVMASLHHNSLNTIRVLSFFFEEEIHIISVIVRMGSGNARIDNVTAGGMQCGVNMDGTLYPKACTKKRDWVEASPDGALFAEVTIPAFDKIIDIVKREHVKLPHFRLIGWDFTVSPKEEPIMIEYNVCPGANQMTCGPTFGDLTDSVLEDVFIKKSLARSQN